MYYPSSENKGADQLRGYREADLRLCFRLGKNPVFSRCGSYMPYWFSWVVIFETPFGCHDILILGKSPVKLRQHLDTTIAVDCHIKHKFKQRYKASEMLVRITGFIAMEVDYISSLATTRKTQFFLSHIILWQFRSLSSEEVVFLSNILVNIFF